MKSKFGRVPSVNVISAAVAGMLLLACSAFAFSPYDDKKKEKSAPPPPPPAHSAPAQQAAPPQHAAQPAAQPARTAPVHVPPQIQNNAPQVQNPRHPPNNNGQPNTNSQPNTSYGRNPNAGSANPNARPNTNGPSTTPYGRSNIGSPNPNGRPNTNVQPTTPYGRNTTAVPNNRYPNPGAGRPNFNGGSTNPRTSPTFNGQPRTFRSPSGSTAVIHDGRVRTMTTSNGMRVSHVGDRREVFVRRGDRVIVTNARGHGYVQREVVVRNQRFVQRTYYSPNGVRYAHIYRPYYYRGAVVNVYAPVRYYNAGFYTYAAANPWRTPIAYRWGWMSDPWYNGYGGVYFTPYPVYSRPSLWLTDYLIAASFQEGYQASLDTGSANFAANNFAAPLGNDVKEMISQEVQQQLAWERAQAQPNSPNVPPQSAEPPIVADHASHTLVAYSSLNADSGGQECTITESDVLHFDAAQPLSGTSANVQVVWSKPNDCTTGSLVTLPIEQLQEMQNHMLEHMNQGLEQMQSQQGQNGLPRLGPGLAGSHQAAYAAELPQPDPNVADELREQAQEADSAVNQLTDEAASAWAPPPPQPEPQPQQVAAPTQLARRPITIVKNMPMEDVISALGQPTQVVDTGKKKILIYPSLKITIEKGKVNKVE
jgi:hypothetical protein